MVYAFVNCYYCSNRIKLPYIKHTITSDTDFGQMSGLPAVICSKIATHIFYKYAKTGEISGVLNLLAKFEKTKILKGFA